MASGGAQGNPVPFAAPDIGEPEIAAVVEVLRSGWLTTGPAAAAFEEEFAEAIGSGVHAVALNSATAGLHLALEALGVGPGDEVIVPTWTFTATAEVVRYLGAEPVLVDVTPDTLAIDLDAAAAAVTDRTVAVLPVHFAGLPVPRGDLRKMADSHGLKVVEDAAHCFPAESEGVPIGAGDSDAVVFSFYATKTMTTGEGGMVVTGDRSLADRMRVMRLHGISRDVFDRYTTAGAPWRYEVVAPGYKYNLTDPAAAMGRVQLSRAQQMRDRRAALAARYDRALAGCPLTLPAHAPDGDTHAWHLYVVQLTDDAPLTRDQFIDRMARDYEVGCSVHFIPLHRHPYWRERYHLEPAAFPNAEAAFRNVVSLPLSSAFTDQVTDRVVEATRRVLGC